jgi:hypothetical protein
MSFPIYSILAAAAVGAVVAAAVGSAVGAAAGAADFPHPVNTDAMNKSDRINDRNLFVFKTFSPYFYIFYMLTFKGISP